MITTRDMDEARAREFLATHDIPSVLARYPESGDIELQSDWVKLGCYLCYREQGVEHRWAMMSAVRRAPQMKNSDRTFNEGRRRMMNGMDAVNQRKILELARKAGINTQGKFYVGGLGTYTDKCAWVSTIDDMREVVQKRNLNASGVLNVQGLEVPPPPPVPLAEPLVKEYMGKYLKRDPALRERCRKRPKARRELREMVITKHGKQRKRS